MKLLTYYKGQDLFWFRIFGYGLSFKSVNHGHVPFSIRYGYRKRIKVFGLYVEFLKKEKNKPFGLRQYEKVNYSGNVIGSGDITGVRKRKISNINSKNFRR
jgi:hypothetical protein